MAIPTTQKECTTRRIAALIIGFWDKVKDAFLLKTSRGATNGVASLDANGKVPTSQLPTVPSGNLPLNSSSSAGIVASGSGQDTKSWMTDVNGNPAWRDIQGLKYKTIGLSAENKDDLDSLFGTGSLSAYQWSYNNRVNVLNKPANDACVVISCGFVTGAYAVQLGMDGNDYENPLLIRFRAGGTWGSWFRMRDASWITSGTMSSDRLPLNSSSSAGIVASGSGQQNKVWGTDSNGNPSWRTAGLAEIAETLPRSFINKDSQTTKIWKKVATSRAFTGYQKGSITFLICGDGYTERLGLESIVTVSIQTGGGGSLDGAYIGKYNFRSHCTVELLRIGSTNQYEIWVKAPLSDTSVQLVYLNYQGIWTIESTNNRNTQKTDSEYSTYKSSNPSVADSFYHTYNIAKSSTSQIGGPSTPVYVNSNGEIVTCSNVPVIEHVTSIPVNPTVGTIYAL